MSVILIVIGLAVATVMLAVPLFVLIDTLLELVADLAAKRHYANTERKAQP